MLFSSYIFIFLFLPLTLLLTGLARKYAGLRGALAVLVAASLFFYAYHDVRLLALIGSSIIFNYLWTGIITKAAGRRRYWAAAGGIGANLILLGYFKYMGFFLETVNTLTPMDFNIVRFALPIGISFYTFQQVAYNIDTYSGKIERRDFLSYALFVAFFPQLIAGPIVHHGQLISQFEDREFGRIKAENILIGVGIFGLGLFSKKILADTFGEYATPLFASADSGETLSFIQSWQAALSYTFQIYFDFAGYSTMAVGLGRMFGVRLPINFFSPYKSQNIIAFWRRWHVTLSTFLRDYLYFPLGGNRKGKVRRWFNLAMTMVLGGLWHGASWNFILWGALHGFYLGVNHAWRGFAGKSPRLDAVRLSLPFSIFGWALTFLSVIIAWVGFRAVTLSGNISILKSMFGINGFADLKTDMAAVDLKFSAFLAAAFILTLAFPNMAQIFSKVRATYETAEPGKVFGIMPLVYRPNMTWTLALAAIAGAAVFYLAPTSEFLYWAF